MNMSRVAMPMIAAAFPFDPWLLVLALLLDRGPL
jgi:hypothetical protein